MTFIAPGPTAATPARPFAAPRRVPRPTDRRPAADEDGARLALGADQGFSTAARLGASIEHLARIALG